MLLVRKTCAIMNAWFTVRVTHYMWVPHACRCTYHTGCISHVVARCSFSKHRQNYHKSTSSCILYVCMSLHNFPVSWWVLAQCMCEPRLSEYLYREEAFMPTWSPSAVGYTGNDVCGYSIGSGVHCIVISMLSSLLNFWHLLACN